EIERQSRDHTAIGTAIEQALAAYPGQPLAGILLCTDGQSNSGPSPLSCADLLEASGIPLQILAFGTRNAPRNLAVTAVESSPVVFVGDPLRVAVHVDARGLEGESARLVFERRIGGGPFELVQEKTIELGPEGALATHEFSQVFETETTVDFRAWLEALPGEVTEEDNLASTTIRVVRRKLRCLLVAGLAFPEVQFLINTLMRDPGIELSSWMMFADDAYQQKGNHQITRLPRTEEEMDQYDCVVLYDPDLSQLPPGFTESLAHLVGDRAGGLVFIAGESATSDLFERRYPNAAPLLDLLPVVREPGSFRTAVESALAGRTLWTLDVTPEGLEDAAFQFAADPLENAKILQSLPGFYWHFAVNREKPGATVLARHGDPRMSNRHGRHVAVATQLFGPGRSYFLAMDSTYRWRFLGEQLFDGFWARIVDRAGRGKVLGGRGAFTLTSDRSLYAPGSVVTLRARFDDPSGRDPGLSVLAGLIQSGDASPEAIDLVPTADDPNV
ncbi:MAG: VWA domain-containing protein, partial [Planctomycetes bacterium]|nr:VWA domain-containing protein [Planctomycetota bacterium]